MSRETLPLDEQQIRERIRILDAVDAQQCPCGTTAGAVADDPDWFIDSVLRRDGTEYAVIRCPWCW